MSACCFSYYLLIYAVQLFCPLTLFTGTFIRLLFSAGLTFGLLFIIYILIIHDEVNFIEFSLLWLRNLMLSQLCFQLVCFDFNFETYCCNWFASWMSSWLLSPLIKLDVLVKKRIDAQCNNSHYHF